jgi:hypothetical protein
MRLKQISGNCTSRKTAEKLRNLGHGYEAFSLGSIEGVGLAGEEIGRITGQQVNIR